MWNYFCIIFNLISLVMLSIHSSWPANEYIFSLWLLLLVARIVLMGLMHLLLGQIENHPSIRYGIKWVLLPLLEELTPPGKWFFWKSFTAMYITAMICSLQSGARGAGINARRLIKFLALHCGWAAYKCFTKGGLINGGFKIGEQDDIVASVIFLLPVLVGIIAVNGWDQVPRQDFFNRFGVRAWSVPFVILAFILRGVFVS